jgi:hypothetical protein
MLRKIKLVIWFIVLPEIILGFGVAGLMTLLNTIVNPIKEHKFTCWTIRMFVMLVDMIAVWNIVDALWETDEVNEIFGIDQDK